MIDSGPLWQTPSPSIATVNHHGVCVAVVALPDLCSRGMAQRVVAAVNSALIDAGVASD